MAIRLTESTPIQFIKGVGEARGAAFARLGIETAGDLLGFYPRAYEERGRVINITDSIDGEICSLVLTVRETSAVRQIRKGFSVFRSIAYDESGSIELVFFNMPFMARSLTSGRRFRAYGRVRIGRYGREMVSPKLEPILQNTELPYYVPVYRLSPPLTQKVIRQSVLSVLPLCESLPELLPKSVIEKYELLPRSEAVSELHCPTTPESLQKAKKTLAFTEITVFRLALSQLRSEVRRENACPLGLKNTGIKSFFSSLPFELTNAQKKAVKEIFADLGNSYPMARLLQGDVGSGKTAVAAAALYLCVKNGYQACMMAPTEILATQHKKTLDKFLSPFGIRTELLISGMPASEKRRVRAGLADGSIDIAVGTHALITDKTEFSSCALAVVDEQHRFGVKQRKALLDKSENGDKRAHMLVMSATPIPRSLSLIIFGDLDVSLLDELPPGRQKIETRIIPSQSRDTAYQIIRDSVAAGGRAYIVCPLIESGEDSDGQENERVAAEEHFKSLSEGELKGIPMGLLHGRMKPDEKASVMADFASGKTSVLVSTTVIEVGVDVPEATVMVIENAESFGLSQLHQLRGRIGRGSRRSVCLLIHGKNSDESADRLKIMRDTSDGFKVAEADLEKRGPGDFFGVRQSGEFSVALAGASDIKMLASTDSFVKEILNQRDNEEYKPLFDAAERFLERNGDGRTVN
ncbi:MAG: ATP-dependent DNA helicase RecG [Ruminococcaceae bacterium]|nr:ATP-dependent DNA helicase RecG [Oscillospiraceae bacterium]